MSNALPSIVTDVGEMGAVVLDGKTGIVVAAKDTEGVSNAMRDLAANERLRKAMGLAARDRVHRYFGLDAMVDRLEEIYMDRRDRADC